MLAKRDADNKKYAHMYAQIDAEIKADLGGHYLYTAGLNNTKGVSY